MSTMQEQLDAANRRIAELEAVVSAAQAVDALEDLRGSVLSVAWDEGTYDGENPEYALDCIRAALDGYSKFMWRLQRLCNSDSAHPDDVEARIRELADKAGKASSVAPESAPAKEAE